MIAVAGYMLLLRHFDLNNLIFSFDEFNVEGLFITFWVDQATHIYQTKLHEKR